MKLRRAPSARGPAECTAEVSLQRAQGRFYLVFVFFKTYLKPLCPTAPRAVAERESVALGIIKH